MFKSKLKTEIARAAWVECSDNIDGAFAEMQTEARKHPSISEHVQYIFVAIEAKERMRRDAMETITRMDDTSHNSSVFLDEQVKILKEDRTLSDASFDDDYKKHTKIN